MGDKLVPEAITWKIVTALEEGILPWKCPWSSNRNEGPPTSLLRNWRFSGVNHLLMNIQSSSHGFRSKWWATEKQWRNLGGEVSRKPDGIPVISWGQAIRPHGKYYYNIDQVQGNSRLLDSHRFIFKHKPLEANFDAVAHLIKATGVKIRFGAEKAMYHYPPKDYIDCPDRKRFEKTSEFVTTILHEMGHWAMHHMNMDYGYATNELIVQLMACYLGADLGFPVEDDLENHAAYLGAWLKNLKANPSYILYVSKEARRISNKLVRI